MRKAATRGQALEVVSRVCRDIKWNEIGSAQAQEVIDLTPEDLGKRLTLFLRAGANCVYFMVQKESVRYPKFISRPHAFQPFRKSSTTHSGIGTILEEAGSEVMVETGHGDTFLLGQGQVAEIILANLPWRSAFTDEEACARIEWLIRQQPNIPEGPMKGNPEKGPLWATEERVNIFFTETCVIEVSWSHDECKWEVRNYPLTYTIRAPAMIFARCS